MSSVHLQSAWSKQFNLAESRKRANDSNSANVWHFHALAHSSCHVEWANVYVVDFQINFVIVLTHFCYFIYGTSIYSHEISDLSWIRIIGKESKLVKIFWHEAEQQRLNIYIYFHVIWLHTNWKVSLQFFSPLLCPFCFLSNTKWYFPLLSVMRAFIGTSFFVLVFCNCFESSGHLYRTYQKKPILMNYNWINLFINLFVFFVPSWIFMNKMVDPFAAADGLDPLDWWTLWNFIIHFGSNVIAVFLWRILFSIFCFLISPSVMCEYEF